MKDFQILITRHALKDEAFLGAAESVIGKVRDGHISPLEAFVFAKAYRNAYEFILSQIEKDALREASLYSRNDRQIFGVGFYERENADALNFRYDAEYKRIYLALKEREKLLKKAYRSEGSEDLTDDKTGDIVPRVPVKTRAKNSLIIQFKSDHRSG